MSRWGIGLSEKMKACKEAEPFTDILEGDGGVPEKDPPSSSKAGFKVTTMKIIVWVCILNGLAWVWCSYILAYLDKMQIAESLSQVAVTEIIGVVLSYAIKSLVENLSKNNNWPDKRAAATQTADTAGPEPEREEPSGVGQ